MSEKLIIAGWVPVKKVTTSPSVGRAAPPELLTISECQLPELPQPEPWIGGWFQARDQADLAAGVQHLPLVVTVAMRPHDSYLSTQRWAEGDDAPNRRSSGFVAPPR